MQTLATKAPATEAQINIIKKLLADKIEDPKQALEGVRWLNTHKMSKAFASAKITQLLAMPTVNRDPAESTGELDEGMYRMNDDIFKVYRTQAGHLATKQLTEDGFEYTGRKPLYSLTAEHRMTLDEAKAYGKVTGTCCNCGRTLTNEESIEAGIGPICANKF